ncbi:hypothetical protein CA51_40730 [Rosistilla oblonga]|nr:hypothetical protein CA51_40730 [Rosistilla oblonga]
MSAFVRQSIWPIPKRSSRFSCSRSAPRRPIGIDSNAADATALKQIRPSQTQVRTTGECLPPVTAHNRTMWRHGMRLSKSPLPRHQPRGSVGCFGIAVAGQCFLLVYCAGEEGWNAARTEVDECRLAQGFRRSIALRILRWFSLWCGSQFRSAHCGRSPGDRLGFPAGPL